MADDYKYHIDHHGSLVRPPALQAARASGDAQALAAAQEQAVAEAAHMQRRLTLSAVGDGQFRRDYFESVVYDHVAGFGPADGPAPLADIAGIAPARRRVAPDEPRASGRLAQAEVAPVLATVDRPVFVALPSPGYLAALGSSLADAASVDAVRTRGEALAAILRQEIQALAADGVAYVALGNPLYAPLLTVAGRERLAADIDTSAALGAMVAVDRVAVTGLEVPENFRVGLDLTDSGPLPTTGRGYDPVALNELLDEIPFHRLCVDFPLEASARLPLDLVKPGLLVSLGIVDVSTGEAESIDGLLEVLDPIFSERGDDDLAVATNGGFAACADQPLMDADQQRAKLRLIETVARYYWGNEI